MKNFFKSRRVLFASGMVLGALIILVIRFATYKLPAVHYHANFDVYINGQRELFRGPTYYEEETACKVGNNITPADRAHMHDNIDDVIHVHDHAVTWEQFFNNIGWSIGGDFIETRDTLYQNSGSNQLHIILNGQDLTGLGSIANNVIHDKDRLLVDFGSTSEQTLQKEFTAVPHTAAKYDTGSDPKTYTGAEPTTFHDRITHLF